MVQSNSSSRIFFCQGTAIALRENTVSQIEADCSRRSRIFANGLSEETVTRYLYLERQIAETEEPACLIDWQSNQMVALNDAALEVMAIDPILYELHKERFAARNFWSSQQVYADWLLEVRQRGFFEGYLHLQDSQGNPFKLYGANEIVMLAPKQAIILATTVTD